MESPLSFKDIALLLIARGIYVVPVRSGMKKCTMKYWPDLATLDPSQIEKWNNENPNSNVACVGKPNGTLALDCDIKGLASQIEKETGQKFPPTLIVKSAGRGCAHIHFKQTDRSRQLGNRTALGRFELRSRNEYVIGPGSTIEVDGQTRAYEIFRDEPLADFPDWLGDWIEANSQKPKECKASHPTVQEFDIDALLNHYDLGYDIKGDWYITDVCPVAGRKHEQSAATGFFYDGEHLGFHCFAGGCPGSTMTISQVLKHLNHPGANKAVAPYTGPIWSTDKPTPTVVLAPMAQNPPKEGVSVKEIPYPLAMWAGTEYEDFAEICQKGNHIPKEFFIEAIKTVVGAVVAGKLSAPALEGGIPRFYTVLMTAGGGGKGTAIKYACSVFREKWLPLEKEENQPLLWSPSTKIENVYWKGDSIGACVTAFSSAPGMQRTLEKDHTRWLQVHEELSSVIESTGVEGSGQGLLAANRQLYDSEHFTTTATAKRDACAGMAQNSILAGTTPELWEDMFSGKQVEGSGLFQRFNLIAAEQPQRVGTLLTPKLEDFSIRLGERVKALQAEPCRLTVGREALECMNEWFGKLSAPGEDGQPDPDEYGRLNVLAWRNAIHLAWLKRQTDIRLADVEAAIKLSDYQYAVRKKHKPALGETRYAQLEGKITKLLEEAVEGKLKERKAYRELHAYRYGFGVWNSAIKNLQSKNCLEYAEEETKGGGPATRWLILLPGGRAWHR